MLESRFFRLGATGVLTACGGDTEPPNKDVMSGSGGGGRIAVWCGRPWRPNLTRGWCVKSDSPLEDPDAAEKFLCEGTIRVAAGEVAATYVQDVSSLRGADGTTFFGFVRDQPKGIMLIFK